MRYTVEYTTRVVDDGKVEIVSWGSTPFDYDAGPDEIPASACILPLKRLTDRMGRAGFEVGRVSYAMTTLAQLFLTYGELETLAGLVDEAIEPESPEGFRWSELNSLRTALREAQFGLQRQSEMREK